MANTNSTFQPKSFQFGRKHEIPICVYCGDYFQCRDHTIPISYSQSHRNYVRGHTVKCCLQCNNALGSHCYLTTIERAGFLLEWYKLKHKKRLNFPEWTEEEIDELGYNIRTMVLRGLYLKHLFTSKVHNLELTSEGFAPTPIYQFRSERFRNSVE